MVVLMVSQLSYMMSQEPWYPEDFPKQYIAHVKCGYYPPTIILGAGVTANEFMKYATNYFKEKGSYPEVFENCGWICAVGRHLRDVCGLSQEEPILLHKIWTRSDTPCVLPICANYNIGKRFPTEQCEKLLDELGRKGVKADIQWFLVEDYDAWDVSPEELDWSGQYDRYLALRRLERLKIE